MITYPELIANLESARIKTETLQFATLDVLNAPLSQILKNIANLLLSQGFGEYKVDYTLNKQLELFHLFKTDSLKIRIKNIEFPEVGYELMYNQRDIANYILNILNDVQIYDQYYNANLQNAMQQNIQPQNNIFNQSNSIFNQPTMQPNNNAMHNPLFSQNNNIQQQIQPSSFSLSEEDINKIAQRVVELLKPLLLTRNENVQKNEAVMQPNLDDLGITEEDLNDLQSL